MKPLVIYHANCADGFGAAFAAWTVLGDEAEYLPLQYGFKPSDLSPCGWAARDVYMLDFSLPRDLMGGLFTSAKRVVWLDHHASVFKDWGIPTNVVGDNSYFSLDDAGHHVKLDNAKSGAMLAWEFFHPGTEVPQFIKHIDDYDRWCFQIEGTKAFNKALWSYAPWGFKQWLEWFYDCESGFSHKYWADFYTEGSAILRSHDQNVQAVVKGAGRACQMRMPATMGEGFLQIPGLSANCPPHLTSDVGHELATQSGTFGLCWCLSKEGTTAQCSLRSNGEYDVSAIAKAFGGGGHRNAAGFQVDIQTLLGWLKAVRAA